MGRVTPVASVSGVDSRRFESSRIGSSSPVDQSMYQSKFKDEPMTPRYVDPEEQESYGRRQPDGYGYGNGNMYNSYDRRPPGMTGGGYGGPPRGSPPNSYLPYRPEREDHLDIFDSKPKIEPEMRPDMYDRREYGQRGPYGGEHSRGPPEDEKKYIPQQNAVAEHGDIDAGRRKVQTGYQKTNAVNRNFDPQSYKGLASFKFEDSKSVDKRNLPAVYELAKIVKKAPDPSALMEVDDTSPETIIKIRSEHAKLEIQFDQLKTLVERTLSKETELKRRYQGRSLQDNKEFCDNMKLQLDAKRKMETIKKDLGEKDILIKKLIATEKMKAEKAEKECPEEAVEANKDLRILSTAYVDEAREDVEENVEGVNRIEYFDAGDHWCEKCDLFFPESCKELLDHLHCPEHWSKVS